MVGPVIAALRKERGLSQEDLAEKTGLSRGAIAQIELGYIRSPKGDTLQKIADAFGVTVGYLLGHGEATGPDQVALAEEIAGLAANIPEWSEILQLLRELDRDKLSPSWLVLSSYTSISDNSITARCYNINMF